MDARKHQLESGVDSDEIQEETPKKPRWCKCFKYDGVCFRTSAAALVVFVYLLIGGAIFVGLERPQEDEQNTQVESAQEQLGTVEDQIITLLTTNQTVDSVTAENLTNTLKQLTLQNGTSTTDNWNFGSSIFFCTTIITTIGYGNIAPTTNGGRAFFIPYALVGIPLALIFLTLLGKILNNVLDWLLEKTIKRQKKQWVKTLTFVTILIMGLILFIFIPAVIFYSLQGWTYFESMYYCFVTLTTVGFGDFVPSREPDGTAYQGLYRVCASGWIWFGLAFVALLIARVQNSMEGLGKKCNKACSNHCKSCYGEKESSEELKMGHIPVEACVAEKRREKAYV